MTGEDERLSLASAIADERGAADALEVVIDEDETSLTRFTRNAIHQNLDASQMRISIRAILDGRFGSASTHARDAAELRATRDRAIALARLSPQPDPVADFPRARASEASAQSFDEEAAYATPSWRADAAQRIFKHCKAAGVWAAGYIATGCTATAVANSHGVAASFRGAKAGTNVKCVAPTSTGYAEFHADNLADVDVDAVAATAIEKALLSANPAALEVGEYTVIVEPAVLGELLAYLVPHFSAALYHEGGSFLSDTLGSRVVGENVTIFDDVRDPLHASRRFDREGAPTQTLALIEGGVARAFVTDREWSERLGVANTGHNASDLRFARGPMPRNLVVRGGPTSRAQLIEHTEHGVLITRSWYIRSVDQRKTIVTGMTRDGTFEIRDGKVVRGVRNMRFNVNLLELLTACTFAADPALTVTYASSSVVPSARFERFRFTSVTDF